jgi:yeast amino acid transporter
MEIITITAFEANDASAVRWPSRYTPFTIFCLYFLCTLGEILNVKWNDSDLPSTYAANQNGISPTDPPSDSMVIIAVWKAGYQAMAGFLNGAFIFSRLSACNTSLYVCSRTLYGIAQQMQDTSEANWFQRLIGRASRVGVTGVPGRAILVSVISFCWLPFVQFGGGLAHQDVCLCIVRLLSQHANNNNSSSRSCPFQQVSLFLLSGLRCV